MEHVFKHADEQGFELVEKRTKIAKSHTFSQKTDGMRDLNLTQYVFSRKTEAGQVREYVHSRMQQKGEITGGTVRYGDGKTRTLV